MHSVGAAPRSGWGLVEKRGSRWRGVVTPRTRRLGYCVCSFLGVGGLLGGVGFVGGFGVIGAVGIIIVSIVAIIIAVVGVDRSCWVSSVANGHGVFLGEVFGVNIVSVGNHGLVGYLLLRCIVDGVVPVEAESVDGESVADHSGKELVVDDIAEHVGVGVD